MGGGEWGRMGAGMGSPKQNGVTAESNTPKYKKELCKKHLPCIIGYAINCHYRNDIKKKRMLPVQDVKKFKKDMQQKVVDLFAAQNGLCHYSGIPMTIENLWSRFSLERLDNTKAHFNPDGTIPDTTVLVCRIFNGRSQMSRKKLLTYYLSQQLVEVPAEARLRVQHELDTL